MGRRRAILRCRQFWQRRHGLPRLRRTMTEAWAADRQDRAAPVIAAQAAQEARVQAAARRAREAAEEERLREAAEQAKRDEERRQKAEEKESRRRAEEEMQQRQDEAEASRRDAAAARAQEKYVARLAAEQDRLASLDQKKKEKEWQAAKEGTQSAKERAEKKRVTRGLTQRVRCIEGQMVKRGRR